tara:strand:- start:90 stop:422 length:333 start_codon:yes stop_codon:yes gene_type:complete
MKDLEIEFPVTPITKKTFIRQGWEKCIEEEVDEEGEVTKFFYWVLPIPKDNPDNDCAQIISSANDEWEEYPNLKKGEYCVELLGFFGLGLCWTEEEIEILYKSLTHLDIE